MASPHFALSAADRLTLRHFRKSLPTHRRADFDHSFYAIMDAERVFATDPVTQGHLVIGACVVSAQRAWIRDGFEHQSAKAKVAARMSTFLRRSLRLMMWALAFFSKDVFESLRRYTKQRGASAFGPSFDIRYAETEDGFVSEVHTCGYRAFLLRHDAVMLLDLFCEWDRIWIDALPDKVRFHRPPTQAHGGATCRFEFKRG